jgi:hypothetical protein
VSERWVRRAGWATAAVAVLALAPGANASTRCAKRSPDPLAPVLIKPCAGAGIRAGHNLTFRVRASDPYAAQPAYYPYLNLTRERPRHRILPSDNGYGIYAQMSPVRNHPGRFSYRAPRYRVPGYWLFRRGVWYLQVLQVDGSGPGAIHYGPVERIVIH